ncbi:hypothetical protein K458DRAFT_130158 [Lentithecium fluviatile CBS 122367]|uniref:C2H2-type domain-containing protein n=1 Tax=Lentithecium fluviatile CBS 122367 TaxID=1168545 RepID=A0A6G1JH97_9PLEO|nr:hypothetical protein K458DRAFT_130158 [Lentithecium fluviatile CBS 122367]
MRAPKKRHYCGMCEESFKSRASLNEHIVNHPEPEPQLFCQKCPFSFPDSVALEKHIRDTGHGAIKCENCRQVFVNDFAYNTHRRFPSGCADAFRKKKQNNQPVSEPTNPFSRRPSGYVDLDAPQQQPSELQYDDSSWTPTDISGLYCRDCNSTFESQARLDRHSMRCAAQVMNTNASRSNTPRPHENVVSRENEPVPLKATTSTKKKPQQAQSLAGASRPLQRATNLMQSLHSAPLVPSRAPTQMQLQTHGAKGSVPQRPSPVAAPLLEPAPLANAGPATPLSSVQESLWPASGAFACNIQGCQRTCHSETGLEIHQIDVHGVGDKALNIQGEDSWMLSQHARSQSKEHGLLRSSGPSQSPRNVSRGAGPSITGNSRGTSRGGGHAMKGNRPPPLTPKAVGAANPTTPLPLLASNVPSTGGDVADLEQAKTICGQILRLRIQADIEIQHDGKLLCGGVTFTRIPVAKQADAVGMFDKIVHLPKFLQAEEYLPAPKAFEDEYQMYHPVGDFRTSPERNPTKPGLAVVAVSCNKIVLADGLEEVIEFAAVDVLTCRILLSHLVFGDMEASIRDWRTRVTGWSSKASVKLALGSGYKILKGWQAARAALWKFIDRETIIVGHNLRGDLDSLRMVHGRAVDIVKVVEKAAGGPLSKQQLSLDSLSREYPGFHLKASLGRGRDVMVDAFAVREFGLWTLKHGEELAKKAKRTSLEYQRTNQMLG